MADCLDIVAAAAGAWPVEPRSRAEVLPPHGTGGIASIAQVQFTSPAGAVVWLEVIALARGVYHGADPIGGPALAVPSASAQPGAAVPFTLAIDCGTWAWSVVDCVWIIGAAAKVLPVIPGSRTEILPFGAADLCPATRPGCVATAARAVMGIVRFTSPAGGVMSAEVTGGGASIPPPRGASVPPGGVGQRNPYFPSSSARDGALLEADFASPLAR